MARRLVLLLLLVLVGCGPSEQRIRIQPGESTADAVERVAKTLPEDRANEFRLATAAVIMISAMDSTSADGTSDPARKAIEGKTPSQIIAESNRHYEKVPKP